MGAIILEDLKVRTHIGVTERERSRRQKLLVSVEIERNAAAMVSLPASPGGGQAGRPDAEGIGERAGDSIESTVDYSEVRRAVREYFETLRCNLIETAAAGAADMLRARFGSVGIRRIRVTVKKFPYRDAKFAAYRCDLPLREADP